MFTISQLLSRWLRSLSSKEPSCAVWMWYVFQYFAFNSLFSFGCVCLRIVNGQRAFFYFFVHFMPSSSAGVYDDFFFDLLVNFLSHKPPIASAWPHLGDGNAENIRVNASVACQYFQFVNNSFAFLWLHPHCLDLLSYHNFNKHF